MIRLWVKATDNHSAYEGTKSALQTDEVVYVSGYRNEHILDVPDHLHMEVAKWYCEVGTAPFPNGTLLFYRVDSKE